MSSQPLQRDFYLYIRRLTFTNKQTLNMAEKDTETSSGWAVQSSIQVIAFFLRYV